MLLILLIIAALFLIGVIFYRQSLQEYRINQIEWEQRHELDGLFEERAPVVIRGIPQAPVWNHSDIMMRDFYSNERPPGAPEGKTLRDMLLDGGAHIPVWPASYRKYLFQNSALGIWYETTWAPVLAGSRGWVGSMIPVDGECFVGDQGLMQTKAHWTLIAPTEGAIIVNILASKETKWLPKKWQGLFPSKMTAETAPFINRMKYMDVIIRPGTGLWVPSHWLISWTAKDEGSVPLVTGIQIHTPASWLASR